MMNYLSNRKRPAFIVALLISLTAFTLPGKTWKNDAAHSQLLFTVTHLGVSDVTGTFNDFEVSIIADKPDLKNAVIELNATVGSIDTRVEQRDTHLKSADFLDAEKFPTISFKSTGIKAVGKNKFKLKGNLTLHGITKTVVLDLTYRGTTENPLNKKQTLGYRVTGQLSRKDFNVGAKFAPPLISDIINIKADGEFQPE